MKTNLILLGAIALIGASAQAREFDDPEVQSQLAELKAEPSVRDAQEAALRFFNISTDGVNSMRLRANLKALMPDVTAKYVMRDSTIDANQFNLAEHSADEPRIIDDASGKATELAITGTWSLSRLVFNAEVLDVGSLAVLQEGVLKNVTRLYYTRRRLQVNLILNPPKDGATRLSKELRIEELTATLDALTGNLFARYQARLDQRKSRRLRR